MKKILGISAFYHDSAAALVVDGKTVAAAQEERFTREKHTAAFPTQAIKYCLEEGGFEIDELDAVVFYDKPFLKFERLLETYYAFAPKGIRSFIKSVPVWLREKLFLKKQIHDGLREIQDYDKKSLNLFFSEHHLSHAASSFYASGFKSAAILTIDGVGEWCTASIAVGDGNQITTKKEMHFPHSVGLLYSAFTYYLGFKVNSGEYKLMGLSPYGQKSASQTQEYINTIKTQLVDIKPDGSIWLNQNNFSYSTGLRMVPDKKWEQLFGFKRRKAQENITQAHCNLAMAIQQVTEEIVVKMVAETQKLTGVENLCLAGGVALNCVSNSKIQSSGIFKEMYIQPAAGDAGGALGAALAANALYYNQKNQKLTNAYLGPCYSNKEIETANKKLKAKAIFYHDFTELCDLVAKKLDDGNAVGWFQDKMEFGPRALGNRSILADARKADVQKKLNLKVKKRESFRPFAPAVLEENASDYFQIEKESPNMLFTYQVKNTIDLDKNVALDFNDRINQKRSNITGVTHIDYSARVQTVSKTANQKFWTLLNAFKKRTGCAVLINTSFNVRGEPIVCSPLDAYRCFMNTDIEYLVLGNYFYQKTDQPNWQDKKKWQIEFAAD